MATGVTGRVHLARLCASGSRMAGADLDGAGASLCRLSEGSVGVKGKF